MSSLDDYEGRDRIGVGGFADVYRTVHVPTRRPVALKISRKDDESLARIRREIQVQQRLAHANVLRILDHDNERFTWFVTEIAEGNLGEIHSRTPVGEAGAVRLLEEVLGALGAAHRRGFVHRDLSPGNILRTGGRWVLADWGYVSDPSATGVNRLTRTGTGGGTYTWAAPETLQDAHRVDARSDLYALGKIVAWLLTDKVPGISLAPELPESRPWRAFLTRMTEVDVGERFGSAEEALAGMADVIASVSCPEEPAGVDPEAEASDPIATSVSALKRYLVAPEDRIRLFDLITNATQETIRRISDDRFTVNRFDRGEELLERLNAYFECCRPLMHLLFAGCHFGAPEHEDLWTKAVQRVVDASTKLTGGYTVMITLQRMPGLLAMSAAAFGSIIGRRYRNLSAVVALPTLKHENPPARPLVAEINPASVIDRDLLRTTDRFKQRKTPASELMFEFLRELGRSVLVSDSEYEEEFDRFEVLLGLLAVDGGGWSTGCFAWRGSVIRMGGESPVIARVRREFEAAGAQWGPLSAGLFAADPERVKRAIAQLAGIAESVGRG